MHALVVALITACALVDKTIKVCQASEKIGFYLQIYKEPDAVIETTLANIRFFYPCSPITVLSDHGNDYTALVATYNATFVMAAQNINTDKTRPPYRFDCATFLNRLMASAAAMRVKWMFYWEIDARALGTVISQYLPFDMMQMHMHGNRFSKFKGLEHFIRKRFPTGMAPMVHGWSSAGGTLFNANKLLRATRPLSLLQAKNFNDLNRMWKNLPDEVSDICLFGAALMANMTIGNWKHFHDLLYGIPRECGCCLSRCQTQCTSAPVDACIYSQCTKHCPAILHNVDQSWKDLKVPIRTQPTCVHRSEIQCSSLESIYRNQTAL